MINIFLFFVLCCGFFGCTSEEIKPETKKEVKKEVVQSKKQSETKAPLGKAKISLEQVKQVRNFISKLYNLSLDTRLSTLQTKILELETQIQDAQEKVERINKFLTEKPSKEVDASLFTEELNQAQSNLKRDLGFVDILKKDETKSLFLQENRERAMQAHESLLVDFTLSEENKERASFCKEYLEVLKSSDLIDGNDDEKMYLKSFYQQFTGK